MALCLGLGLFTPPCNIIGVGARSHRFPVPPSPARSGTVLLCALYIMYTCYLVLDDRDACRIMWDGMRADLPPSVCGGARVRLGGREKGPLPRPVWGREGHRGNSLRLWVTSWGRGMKSCLGTLGGGSLSLPQPAPFSFPVLQVGWTSA
jgi:hypothetical protein